MVGYKSMTFSLLLQKKNERVNEIDRLLPFVLNLLSRRMSSAPKELKRHGSTKGMSFTTTQADDLLQQHLKKKIIRFDPIDGGLNNLVFFIKCENDLERHVLKVCGDAWEQIKTESEANGMVIVTKYTTIPIPRVVAYSSDKNNEFKAE